MGACVPKSLENGLEVTGVLTASIRTDYKLSPAPECALRSVLAKAANGYTEEKLGGGHRALAPAPGQDSAPWWKADAGHRTVLASLHRNLSTCGGWSHGLLGQVWGSPLLLGRWSPRRGRGAGRFVLQGHTGPILHRWDVWRGLSSRFYHHQQACSQGPSSSLYTLVIQHFPSPDLRVVVCKRGDPLTSPL